jgi:LysR family transcriptional regulator, hydrogen peroxide-inducible genes activator
MTIMASPHDLSIRQLQYVVAVADTLGFHRAAERCHVSQPTLSAQVALVERVLGVTLFERDRRRVLVTAVGREIVARARVVLLAVSDLITTADRAQDPFVGTVRIGVIPTVAPYLLPEITPALAKRFPGLKLVFREEKTDEITMHLDTGELDGGLLAFEAELGDVARAEVATDPFVLALPKGHPLAKRKSVKLADLREEPVLLLDEGHCLREHALSLCQTVGARETDLRATSLATLVQMVSAGTGVTLLPRLALEVENRRAQLEIRPLAAPIPKRTIGFVWRKTAPSARVFEALAQAARSALSVR